MLGYKVKSLPIVVTLVVLATSSPVSAQPQDSAGVKPAPAATPLDTSQSATNGVHWVPFEDGVKLSHDSGKPIFLFCYGSWCPYCQKMLARTFHDTTVIQYLNSYFTSVRIETRSTRMTSFNGTAMAEAQVANKEFGVKAVPTMWLLEPDGCRIKKIKGYYPAKFLLPELQAVHDHTYGPCANVPIVDPPAPPKTPDTSGHSGAKP